MDMRKSRKEKKRLQGNASKSEDLGKLQRSSETRKRVVRAEETVGR